MMQFVPESVLWYGFSANDVTVLTELDSTPVRSGALGWTVYPSVLHQYPPQNS